MTPLNGVFNSSCTFNGSQGQCYSRATGEVEEVLASEHIKLIGHGVSAKHRNYPDIEFWVSPFSYLLHR